MAQQFETAQFLPADVRERFGHELVCYARFVVNEEWPKLESSTEEDTIDTSNPWQVALFRTLKADAPANRQRADRLRQVARPDLRSRGGPQRPDPRRRRASYPGPCGWCSCSSPSRSSCSCCSSPTARERAVTQAMMIGSVIAVIAATLLLIRFLDDPFRDGFGGLKPMAMERTLRILDAERRVVRGHRRPAVRRERHADLRPRRMTRRTPAERMELAATLLLVLATVATAWASYQASRWHSEQAEAQSRATALRLESTRASGRGEQGGRDRPRALHPVGRRAPGRATPSWPPSTAPASATGSSRRSGRGSQRSRSRTPTRRPRPSSLPEYRLAASDRGRASGGAGGRRHRRGEGGHSARRQLRARGGPLRSVALLRRPQPEAAHRRRDEGDARPGIRLLRGRGDLDRHVSGERVDLAALAQDQHDEDAAAR